MSGGACILGVTHASHPKRAYSSSPLPIFVVLLYLYLHPLMQNDQIWQSNTYREGRVLRSQSRNCVCTTASRGLSTIAEFLVTGSAIALHCGKAHVQSRWERANFDSMTSKSLTFFKFELDVHDYITSANFRFTTFSGGFSPDS